MKNIHWDNNLCEPVVITYNRANALDETLAAFFYATKDKLPFHVLDNCSTDNTSHIVEKWQRRWPNLYYHRNVYNIGGNANILRALEITNSDYSWIIGDDDLWHLQHIEEVVKILSTKRADIIRLGWLVSEQFAGRFASSKKLFNQEHLFFASLGMISSTIVRRSIMSAHLPWSYSNISCAYPQLVPCIKAFEEKRLEIYSVRDPLLTHTPSKDPGFFFGDLEWYLAWFKTSRFFTSKKSKKKFIAEAVRYMIRPKQSYFSEFIWLLKVALNAKAHRVPQRYYIAELFLVGYGWRFRLFCLALIYVIFPGWLARLTRHFYSLIKKKPWKGLMYDRSRL